MPGSAEDRGHRVVGRRSRAEMAVMLLPSISRIWEMGADARVPCDRAARAVGEAVQQGPHVGAALQSWAARSVFLSGPKAQIWPMRRFYLFFLFIFF
jgi:hypothetical protein